MARPARSLGASLLSCAAVVACSWSRFDDLKEGAPVELLDAPVELPFGFGHSVSVAARGDSVLALVAGRAPLSQAATFRLGPNEDTATESNDPDYCESSSSAGTCSLANRTAGLGRFVPPGGGEKELCFALGFGQRGDVPGVVGRCADGFQFALATPDGVDLPVEPPEQQLDTNDSVPELYLASDRDETPALLAASPTRGRAWFYAPESDVPVELVPAADAGPDFGRSLAVVRLSSARVYAVGDPRRGEVWLFRAEGNTVETLGCLGDSLSTAFGSGLDAGPIDGADGDELVITDAASVRVLSGATLASVAPSASDDCDFDWLPDAAVLGRASCVQSSDTSGCSSSEFGAAVAVADLDGDGTGEIAVGAPRMTVRGTSGAGAVVIYDLTQAGLARADTRILSSAEGGDRFGAALAAAPQRTRDVLVVGVPGREKTAVVYCGALVQDGQSSRCQ